MGAKTDLSLKNFFIFNSTLSKKEGEEMKKILYYYPITDHTDVQIKNMGLVEGIINFTRTFKAESNFSFLHTQKTRQIYFEAEKNYSIVMILNVPTVTKVKEGAIQCDYLEDDIQDKVYEYVLKMAYYMFRLFHGKFESIVENQNVNILKTQLEIFFNQYLKTLNLANADILNIFSGIQYLPLDKTSFLKVQCLINSLECDFPIITQAAFLYNDHLIWSGIEPSDMQIIYQYLVHSLFPSNLEVELQGGSMPRNSLSPSALHHGRFITGPVNLKTAKSIGKVPKVYTFSGGSSSCYHLVIYRALSASLCLFIKATENLTLDIFKELDSYLNTKMTVLVSDIAEYCSKQVLSPSTSSDTPKFIYFNQFNLAYKSTVHLDNRQTGNITINNEQLKIIADMNIHRLPGQKSGETIIKTLNDYWVVSKTSNYREFYVVEQKKNGHLMDISKDIKNLCESELKGIFFQPL